MNETQTTPARNLEAIQIAVELFKHQDTLYWANYGHFAVVQGAQFAGTFTLIAAHQSRYAIALILLLGFISVFIYMIGSRHMADAMANKEAIEGFLKIHELKFLEVREEFFGSKLKTKNLAYLFFGVIALANLVLLGLAIKGFYIDRALLESRA